MSETAHELFKFMSEDQLRVRSTRRASLSHTHPSSSSSSRRDLTANSSHNVYAAPLWARACHYCSTATRSTCLALSPLPRPQNRWTCIRLPLSLWLSLSLMTLPLTAPMMTLLLLHHRHDGHHHRSEGASGTSSHAAPSPKWDSMRVSAGSPPLEQRTTTTREHQRDPPLSWQA